MTLISRILFVLVTSVFLLVSFQATHAGQTKVQVNINTQTARVVLPNGKVFFSPVSTGKKGYRTPRGTYKVYWRKKMHYSSKYDNSPMPFSMFFRGGYALHQGNVKKGYASHGCVRFPRSAIKRIYNSSIGHIVKVQIR